MSNKLFATDFTAGIDFPFSWSMNNRGGSWGIVDDPAAAGGKAVQISLPPGGERVEFNARPYQLPGIQETQELGMILNMKFPTGYAVGDGGYGWHEFLILASEYIDMSTIFSWWGMCAIAGGTLRTRMKRGIPGQSPTEPWAVVDANPFTGGIYHTVKIHMKRDVIAGFIKMWVDGLLTVNVLNKPTKSDRDSFYTSLIKVYGENVHPADNFSMWLGSAEFWDGEPIGVGKPPLFPRLRETISAFPIGVRMYNIIDNLRTRV